MFATYENVWGNAVPCVGKVGEGLLVCKENKVGNKSLYRS